MKLFSLLLLFSFSVQAQEYDAKKDQTYLESLSRYELYMVEKLRADNVALQCYLKKIPRVGGVYLFAFMESLPIAGYILTKADMIGDVAGSESLDRQVATIEDKENKSGYESSFKSRLSANLLGGGLKILGEGVKGLVQTIKDPDHLKGHENFYSNPEFYKYYSKSNDNIEMLLKPTPKCSKARVKHQAARVLLEDSDYWLAQDNSEVTQKENSQPTSKNLPRYYGVRME